MTTSAREKIRTRLKTYSQDDLLRAIDQFSQDPWWMENNSHRGIAWFFHTDDRVEQFLNLSENGRAKSDPNRPEPKGFKSIRAVMARLEEKRKDHPQ